MQHVDVEFEITYLAVCNFHLTAHAVKKELENQFFFLVAGGKERPHLVI